MTHPGYSVVWKNGSWEGNKTPLSSTNGHRRPLAIVGSHPATRELAPYDDERVEIWLFNEAAQKPEIYKRWDGLLQIHNPEIYSSLENWVNKDHWNWLQQDHGSGKRIFMQQVDPRVPNSVAYPLEGVQSLIPYRYLRSSPALALALAIYLGYTDIALYGSELTSNTEYAYQAINLGFWIGFAHGRGIDFHLECWQQEFNQRIYGFEGDVEIERDYFQSRVDEMTPVSGRNNYALKQIKERLADAMLANDYAKVAELMMTAEETARVAGEAAAVLTEADMYANRNSPINRQEYERRSAQAQHDGEEMKEKMVKESGKSEYVWNVWRQTGSLQALQQLREFIKQQLEYAVQAGAKLGAMRENQVYMLEYDNRVTAAGGVRALSAVGK